jgi:hypothetical protein
MTHVSQVAQLQDGTFIDQIEFELVQLGPEKKSNNPGWASTWLGKAKDGNAFASVTFSFKKNNPEGWVGKRIVVCAGKDKEGRPSGVKTKANGQYMNLHITDSAKITIAGDSQPSFSSPTTASSTQQRHSTPVKIDAEAMAKHLATEWCTVYDWTAPIFETRLNKDQIKECVTGIVIEMRRNHIQILDPYKDNWREVEFKGEKLGTWKPDRIKSALIKVWQGAKVSDQVKDALNAASKEPEYQPSIIFRHLLTTEGIDDDDAIESVILRNFKAMEDMTEEDYKGVVSDAGFADAVKKLIASKPSSIDDDDTLTL